MESSFNAIDVFLLQGLVSFLGEGITVQLADNCDIHGLFSDGAFSSGLFCVFWQFMINKPTAFTNGSIKCCVESVNLRSYFGINFQCNSIIYV